jgi:hypothetical protein
MASPCVAPAGPTFFWEAFVQITRRSGITGKNNTLEVPISREDYILGQKKRDAGALIQEAFPTLSPPWREFLMTGITPEEWDEYINPVVCSCGRRMADDYNEDCPECKKEMEES